MSALLLFLGILSIVIGGYLAAVYAFSRHGPSAFWAGFGLAFGIFFTVMSQIEPRGVDEQVEWHLREIERLTAAGRVEESE